MSRTSFCRSPDDFLAVAKSRSLYSRVSAGGRPRERILTATPPSRRTVNPASRVASRTRRPSATMSAWGSEEADCPPLFVDVDGVSGGRGRTFPALHHCLVRLGRDRAVRERDLADLLDLLVGVRGEAVHRDDGVEPELADGREVSDHVGRAGRDRLSAALGIAAVVLQRLDSGDEDDCARREAADAADDVHELLHPHVRAEAGLGYDDVAELQRDAVGNQRVVAVGDVRERPTLDEGGLALERLDEVRLDRLLEEDGHRTRRLELL